MNDLDQLLTESFHTYKIYLESNNVINDQQVKLTLLKWPDVVQSALGHIRAHEEARSVEEIKISRAMLEQDLIATMLMPLKAIYDATRERIEAVIDKTPQIEVEMSNDPFVLKKNYISAINNMFKALETMTAVKYPVLKEE